MKKFKITKGNRVYIVDAKSHIDAISKVKAVKDAKFLTEDKEAGNVKDSSIKDYSPEVYINELEKLIPEYQRLDALRHKIIESLKSTNKINSDNWRKYDYLSDAKVKQYIKQVRELDKKWNSIISNLNRFNIDSYNQRLDVSDRDIWFDNLPDKSTVDSIKYAVESKSKKYKSSEDIWKDSSIKDYSPEVYVKELEKLIPEYQRLGDLKSKIRESLVSSGKMDKSKMGPDFKLILNDAKVQQWLKQVRELDKKWNNLLTNLNRFGVNEYKQQSNGSDLDVWLNSLPDSWTINDIKFAVKSESRKYKDSISQWNPGMSEIGLFQISYKRNGVYQSILVRANSEEQAKQKLLNNLNGVDIIGVNSHPSPHFHEPILDSAIKDEWSGVRSNGVIFNYSNGKYTITHKNGKVETFPGNKFNTAEELFKYIDNIKDSAVKDGNNQLSVPKNLRVGSRIQTRNGTYTIIAIDNNDIATIQYENGRKFKLALYDIIDELDNVYTTKIIK